MESALIVRYSETTLKGKNRRQFEDRAASNVLAHLGPLGARQAMRRGARLVLEGGMQVDGAEEILRNLPGVANYSQARMVPRELEPLTEASVDYLRSVLPHLAPAGEAQLPFRVHVERKDKHYPLKSPQVEAKLGAALVEQFPLLKVNLERPELTLHVEIWEDRAMLYDRKVNGGGGLPVGSSGKALCLLSGGIDSPVAAYMMMTRGVRVSYLHFHAFPFIGEQSKEKVVDLVRFLARCQPNSRLLVAPFAEVQTAIRDRCPEELRTVLYRRMMNRVANALARRERATVLVTGESVGQVASQTLQNLLVIHKVAELPVMQPLIGLHKQEIIDRAKRIGTLALSQQPFPDCCTLFQPRSPATRAKLPAVERAESALDIEALVQGCLDGLETFDYGPEYYPAAWPA